MESSKENNRGEDSYLDGPNDCNINKTLFAKIYVLPSESAELSTSGNEFHITDEELIECCNKAEVTMKEVNSIDAPEGAHDDNKKKTIVDILFEDFSTTPFNSPTTSPESKLRNLERSPLFNLREKPKRNYSREFREKTKLAFLYDPKPERKASDRGYDDIEKEDTYNVNQSNQRDNISGYSKSLVLRETNVALGLQKASRERPELGEDKNAVGVSEISIENESEEVKSKVNRDEVGKVNNPGSSLVSAGFQTANGKKKPILEKEKHNETGLEDMRDRKKHLLSLNPKFNYRPPQLCETLNRNSRQNETTK
ncbi:hypothetical protein GQX74_011339 [Glossina fuscipes]|nr:hypothetical protein GQX74_011339 [Glossina fuscipes]